MGLKSFETMHEKVKNLIALSDVRHKFLIMLGSDELTCTIYRYPTDDFSCGLPMVNTYFLGIFSLQKHSVFGAPASGVWRGVTLKRRQVTTEVDGELGKPHCTFPHLLHSVLL